MKKKSIVLVVIVACALAWFFLRSNDSDRNAMDVPADLVNRVWVDRVPEKAEQKVDVLVMLGEPKLGQFLRTSVFEGDFAVFEWSEQGGRLQIVLLQSKAKHKMTASVSRKDCGGFDYCMKVKGAPRGAARYVSMEDWVVEPQQQGFGLADTQQFVRDLVAH